MPGATAYAPVWLLLPYMAGLLAAGYAVYLLVRLTAAGEPLRAYIHEQTVLKRRAVARWRLCLPELQLPPSWYSWRSAGKTCLRVSCLSCCRQQQPVPLQWKTINLKR